MDPNQSRRPVAFPGFRPDTRHMRRPWPHGPGMTTREHCLDGIRDLFTLEGTMPANR